MRYTNLKGFEKHLSASTPNQFCSVYLILSADDFERKQAIDLILQHLSPSNGFFVRLNGAECSAKDISQALNQNSLFCSKNIVTVDEFDKKLLDELSNVIKEPNPSSYLILGAKWKMHLNSVEMQGVVLDLLEEKPWDKEKRWMEELHEKAKNAGKRLAPDAASWMIERLDRDSAIHSSEMDKLICYCAHKETIDRSDVEQICSASRTHTLWQIADDFVWNQIDRSQSIDLKEPSIFYVLLASIRQQFMIGLTMIDLKERNVPFSEWGSHFPKIFPKMLEKKAQIAERFGSSYFRKGLDRLFEMEVLAKNSSVPSDALFDRLRFR